MSDMRVNESDLYKLLDERDGLQRQIVEMQQACNQELSRRREVESIVKDLSLTVTSLTTSLKNCNTIIEDLRNIIDRAIAAEYDSSDYKITINNIVRILTEVDDL